MKELNLHQIKKGRLVLEALKKYGLLNTKTLMKVLPSFKHRRGLERTLVRLCERRLIVKRYEQMVGRVGTFYQINQQPRVREILSYYLDCHPDRLNQRSYRYRELYHEQKSAEIQHYLNSKYPDALVLKDFELIHHDEAKSVIPNLQLIEQPKPDILMIFKNATNIKNVSIAIEFEKTIKSKHRLYQKLKFYTHKTHIDGVIYICTQNLIQNHLREIYESRVLDHALRIKQYGDHFLLTAIADRNVENSFNLLKNKCGKTISLDTWILKLIEKETALRRNTDFAEVSHCAVLE